MKKHNSEKNVVKFYNEYIRLQEERRLLYKKDSRTMSYWPEIKKIDEKISNLKKIYDIYFDCGDQGGDFCLDLGGLRYVLKKLNLII